MLTKNDEGPPNILINEKVEFCLKSDINHNMRDITSNNRKPDIYYQV